jgi:acyl-CoA thioester hydrolase
MGGVHRLPIRVYYEDTDFSGVVYHASYLRYLERGRTEQLRELGVSQKVLLERDTRLFFVVRRMAIEFLKPALMDDHVTVETRHVETRGATLDVSQRILRNDDLLVTADVTVACLGDGRPRRIPEDLRILLSK